MLNVLSAAMDEITRELAPGSVDVRLRGLDPDFVVTLPPTDGPGREPSRPPRRSAPAPADTRRGRHRPRQPAPAGPPQGARRGGREPRGPVGQRLAGASRVGRRRRRHPAACDGEDPDRRTELHGLGALAAPPAPATTVTHPPRPTSGDDPTTQEDGTAMPSFDTPEPISVTAHVEAGSIRFTAGDRLDTVVEVRPATRGRTWTCGRPTRPRSRTRAAPDRQDAQGQPRFGRTGDRRRDGRTAHGLAHRHDRRLGPGARRGPARRGPREDLVRRRPPRHDRPAAADRVARLDHRGPGRGPGRDHHQLRQRRASASSRAPPS